MAAVPERVLAWLEEDEEVTAAELETLLVALDVRLDELMLAALEVTLELVEFWLEDKVPALDVFVVSDVDTEEDETTII